MSIRTLRLTPLLAWLGVLLATCPGAAEEFRGKVVGITDGDTLSVLREGRAVTVRLQGIDAPERRQPFGTRAKQYASSLAFGVRPGRDGRGPGARPQRTNARRGSPAGRPKSQP